MFYKIFTYSKNVCVHFFILKTSLSVCGQRVCKMTAISIRIRIFPPRAPNCSVIASPTFLDHLPRTSMMMLYCRMSYSGNCCWSSQQRGAYLVGFSSVFLFSVLRPRAAYFYHQNSLLLVIYKSRIHSVLLHSLTYYTYSVNHSTY